MSKFKKENIISISENFINNLKYYKIKFKDEKDAKSYFPSTISKKDVELCEKLIKNNNIKLLKKVMMILLLLLPFLLYVIQRI